MKNLRTIVFLFLSAGLLSACAHTKMFSLREPAFAGKFFKKILVVAPFADIESRNIAEKAFSEQLSKYGAESSPSTQVFLPLQKYTDKVVLETIKENGYDAILLLNFSDAPTERTNTLETDPSPRGQVTAYGNRAWYSGNTYKYGEYYIATPRVRFEIRLFDTSTQKNTWIAVSLIPGEAFTKFGKLMPSLAEAAIRNLFNDGLLPFHKSITGLEVRHGQ